MPDVDLKQHWHARFHRDPINRWLRGLIHDVFAEEGRAKVETKVASR